MKDPLSKAECGDPLSGAEPLSVSRAPQRCDHKFVDSTVCLKCGLTPEEIASRAPQEQFRPGIDILISVNAALHAVNSPWRIDVRDGQAIAVPTPEVYSPLSEAFRAPQCQPGSHVYGRETAPWCQCGEVKHPKPQASRAPQDVPVPEHHAKAAERFKAFMEPVPMSEAEKMPDPDYFSTPEASRAPAEPLDLDFDKRWPESLLRHVVKTPSQYDSSCRALAGEVLRQRAEVERLTAERDLLDTSVPVVELTEANYSIAQLLSDKAKLLAECAILTAEQERLRSLTPDDCDQIIEGIEHFCIGVGNRDEELDEVWRPYINKLKALREGLAPLSTTP